MYSLGTLITCVGMFWLPSLPPAPQRRQGLSYLANAQVGSELSNNEWFTEVVAQLRARRGPRARTAESDDPALMIVMFQDIQHSEAEFRLLWTFMRMLVMEGRVDEAVEMLQETIDMLATYAHCNRAFDCRPLFVYSRCCDVDLDDLVLIMIVIQCLFGRCVVNICSVVAQAFFGQGSQRPSQVSAE